MTGELFPLGRTVATPGALQALEAAGSDAAELLARHQRGDWGDVEDRDRNNAAVFYGRARIVSCYPLGDTHIWVITEADRTYNAAKGDVT